MQKISFSHNELNKFLLIGNVNSYVIDKINPLIRATKRKNYLAIFCTLRFKKKITTVKLGNFPENKIDEIYSKFDIAYKISKNGNNPNFVFKTLKNHNNFEENNLNLISLKTIQELFFKDGDLSKKYKIDVKNILKKNLKELIVRPIIKLSNKEIDSVIENLIIKKKYSTTRNVLNYLFTLLNYAIKIEDLGNIRNQILTILKNIKKLKTNKIIKINMSDKIKSRNKIIKQIHKLDTKELKKLSLYLDKNEPRK